MCFGEAAITAVPPHHDPNIAVTHHGGGCLCETTAPTTILPMSNATRAARRRSSAHTHAAVNRIGSTNHRNITNLNALKVVCRFTTCSKVNR